MKNLIRMFAYILSLKKIDESKLDVEHIKVKSDDVLYFNLSSNQIISLVYEGKLYYFRECPKIASFKDFFNNYIDDFFETIRQIGINKEHFKQEFPINVDFKEEDIFDFKEYIYRKKLQKGFLRNLSKADLISQKINFSIWDNNIDIESILLEFGFQDVPNNTKEIAIYFLWYMRSVATNYRRLRITRSKSHSFFSSTKSIASRIVAEELKLEHTITNVRWCVLEIENRKEIFGLISDVAPGSRMMDSNVIPNGELQRELMNLNILDLLCFQVDHGPNNYNVYIDNDKYSICAFDNDNPNTFLPYPGISHFRMAGTLLIDKNNMIMRPFFDKELAKRINNLDINVLRKRLKPYLNILQINALICRIQRLKRAIDKTQCSKANFLIDYMDWNKDTIEEELSGKYGDTYLTKSLKINKGDNKKNESF